MEAEEIRQKISAGQATNVCLYDSAGNPIQINGFNLPGYDFISVASNATTDTYTYRTGGASGTVVATITVTYTNETKLTLSSVART